MHKRPQRSLFHIGMFCSRMNVGLNKMTLLLTKNIIQLFLMMLCGYLLIKLKLLKSEDSKVLSILIIYVICPCTILNAFQIALTPETAANYILSFAAAVLIHILLFAMVYLLHTKMHFTAVEKASLLYSNAGNLIIPLVSSVLGEEWVIYTSSFIVVQVFIIWTHGRSIIEGKKRIDLKSIFTNINLIACLIGLAMFLCGLQMPAVLKETVRSIGNTIGPVSMIMLGMILGGVDLGDMLKQKRLWLIVLLKMFALPAVLVMVIKYSGLAGFSADGQTVLYISLLAAMAPAAATVTQLAQLYDNEPGYASAINTITTLICLISMPLLTALYYL